MVLGMTMAKFFINWKLNPTFIPGSLVERIHLWTSMIEAIKEDLKIGNVDWGTYKNASYGFSIVDGDEERLVESLKKWVPYFFFDVKPMSQ